MEENVVSFCGVTHKTFDEGSRTLRRNAEVPLKFDDATVKTTEAFPTANCDLTGKTAFVDGEREDAPKAFSTTFCEMLSTENIRSATEIGSPEARLAKVN